MRTMQAAMILGIFIGTGWWVQSQEPAPKPKFAVRFRVEWEAEKFPQDSPQSALKSVVVALQKNNYRYLVAQLTDPGFVDPRIADYRKDIPKGSVETKTLVAFDRLVRETEQHFLKEPDLLTELREFSKDAEFELNEDLAVGSIKTNSARKVLMKRYEGRWFLENRQNITADKK